ncbi:hypothetical protein [Trichothermofontia sp.]
MAGALKRVEQEMAALDQAVADLAAEMKSVYSSYLAVLGQAVHKQLILACYRLCTQGYPEAFLHLSFPQRQQFQQALRTLAAQAADRLTHLLTPAHPETLAGNELAPDQDHQADDRPHPPDQPPLDRSWDDEEILSSLAAGMKAALEQAQAENRLPEGLDSGDLSAMVQAFFKQSQATGNSDSSPVEQLVRWQKRQEAAIAEQLQRTSYHANRLLQRFNILHQHLPDQVFSAIARADAPEGSSQSPHILNLLVETKERERPSVVVREVDAEAQSDITLDEMEAMDEMREMDEMDETDGEGDDESRYRQPALTHLIALNLRLAEIEFIDPNVMAGRNRIRDLTARLKQLRRTYRKKQREWAIIEAEAAWRSSWVED